MDFRSKVMLSEVLMKGGVQHPVREKNYRRQVGSGVRELWSVS